MLKPLSKEEVSKLIAQLNNKSCELDTIPTDFLKKNSNIFINILTDIVNKSLKNGVFAREWKMAIIRPLLQKIGLELLCKNYRPVSNLNFISKLVEKAALLWFEEHCRINHLMPDYQSAYRENYLCKTALAKICNDLLWSLEKSKVVPLLAIDLSAAFDTVSHSGLLYVLSKTFGVEGLALKWFDTYLRPRGCKVVINDCFSAERSLKQSVPQGSINGPVLYSAYASTLQTVVPKTIDLHGYADDHALKKSFDPNDRIQEKDTISMLSNTMTDVKNWMDENRLKINPDKTEFIIFGSKKQLDKCITKEINICGKIIKLLESIKYLGANLDKHLTMKEFVINKCKKAMSNLQRIKLIRKFLDVDSTKTLVQGLVVSHLDYANVLLAGLPKCLMKKLQLIQNYAAKIICGKRKFDSVTECMKELHWLPCSVRSDFKTLCLVYKSINNLAPLYLMEMFNLKQNSRLLRSSKDTLMLQVPKTKRKTFADRSIRVNGARLWNSIPFYIRNSKDLATFKSQLKTFYFRQIYV